MNPLRKRLNRTTRVFWAAQSLLWGSGFGVTGHLQAQVLARFPVKPEQVQLAMQELDWPMRGVQVRLAAAVTATVANPTLEIASVTPSAAGHEALLRMACQIHTECLPFFASAVWPLEAPMPNLLTKPESKDRSVISSQSAGIAAAPELPTRNALMPNTSVPSVIRPGSSATLLLEGGRVHIQLHVVFAQSGHVGDTVRVTTPDRKQVFVAEVLTPELLRGELQP
ncbi:MAG: hypothetical protein ACRYFU_07830 [Janthinobacterium lividum]